MLPGEYVHLMNPDEPWRPTVGQVYKIYRNEKSVLPFPILSSITKKFAENLTSPTQGRSGGPTESLCLLVLPA